MSSDGASGMPSWQDEFTPADDGPHAPGNDFYYNETFWFSFFVPERGIGAWLYSGIRPNAGVSTGGLWLWDRDGADPWEIPFYEHFSHLKLPAPADATPSRIVVANGNTVITVDPGMTYYLAYDDRQWVTARLRFTGSERPVPLRAGTPPYPKATHYDQTGRVTATLVEWDTGEARVYGEDQDVWPLREWRTLTARR